MEETKQQNKILVGIIVAVILAAIAGAVVMLSGQKESSEPTASQNSTQTSQSQSGDDSTVTTGSYKDGTYKADGAYQSPGGSETVHLTVTLNDGTVTATEFTTDASGGTAKEYQGKFISGYKSLVVGKKIDEVSLDRVAGSSLTSGGFNQALDQIKSDAKA